MSSASLLGLPKELRFLIYDYTIHTAVNYCFSFTQGDAHSDRDLFATPQGSDNLKSRLPWLNLMLTCKHTASEMEAFMSGDVYLSGKANHSYVMDTTVDSNAQDPDCRGEVAWRRIPCHPRNAKALIINLRTRHAARSKAGIGDPAQAAIWLCDISKLVLCCGPRMVYNRPLAHGMNLQKITISIRMACEKRKTALKQGLN